jgi:hypothetical protein
MIAKITLFYSVAAVIVGALVASMESFRATWRGRPIRHPRLVGGIVAGALWPNTLLQFLKSRP